MSGARRLRWTAPAGALLLVAALVACATGFTHPREVTYDPRLEVDLDAMTETSSGLFYRAISEGAGDAAGRGDEVTIHYVGFLPDGTLFENSLAEGEPITFRIGGRQVIRGWEEAVEGMRPGGRRQLVIPPELAYGGQGLGDVIPPDAVLVFEIQLVDVR